MYAQQFFVVRVEFSMHLKRNQTRFCLFKSVTGCIVFKLEVLEKAKSKCFMKTEKTCPEGDDDEIVESYFKYFLN